MNLLQQQNIENALYAIDSEPWCDTACTIWESIGFIFEDYVVVDATNLERFAYSSFDYKYKLTEYELDLSRSIYSISVMRMDSGEADFFIAVDMKFSGSELQRIEEAKRIADVLYMIAGGKCHFLFKCNMEICFVSLIRTTKNNSHFERTVLGTRNYKFKEQETEYKFVSSEWFSYFMPDERWEKFLEIDVDNYVPSFVREVEITNYSADYIIFELNPVKDAYRMKVNELNDYCIDTMVNLFGPEWLNENSSTYVNEIHEEQLSDEDWDLIEFELEGIDNTTELIPIEDDWDDWDEDEDDFDLDGVPEDVINDPVEMLKWLENNKALKRAEKKNEVAPQPMPFVDETNVYSSRLIDIKFEKLEYESGQVKFVCLARNKSGKTLQTWIKRMVIGETEVTWELFGNTVAAYQTQEIVFTSDIIPYAKEISLWLEIDDSQNNELEVSQAIILKCEFIGGQSNSILSDKSEDEEVTTPEYAYFSNEIRINLLDITYSSDNILHLEWDFDSYSDGIRKVWIKELRVDGKSYDEFILLCDEIEEYSYEQEEIEIDLNDIGKHWSNIRNIQFIIEIDDEDNVELESGNVTTVILHSKKQGNIQFSLDISSEDEFEEEECDDEEENLSGTIKELLESVSYKLPIDIQKDNWTYDYHFVVTSVSNGYAYGNTYNGTRVHKFTSYPIDRKHHVYSFYKG